jgi:predicted ABC-type ATPase
MSPSAYIIAGPNGAGKTTFPREFLPNYADCRNFVNADLIAQGMSPFAPEAAVFRAGRLMLEEIGSLAKRGADFGFETTLSGRSHLKLIGQLKKRGYAIHFFYLGCQPSRLRFRESARGSPGAGMMCPRLS